MLLKACLFFLDPLFDAFWVYWPALVSLVRSFFEELFVTKLFGIKLFPNRSSSVISKKFPKSSGTILFNGLKLVVLLDKLNNI